MKKYEKPMVELTKFNAEDIIATSGKVDDFVKTIKPADSTESTPTTFDVVEELNW